MAVLLGVAVLLLLAASGAGRPPGCGQAFVSRVEEYLQASGSPLVGESPTKQRQLEFHRAACAAADGCFANVRVELLGYVSRRAVEAEGAEQAAMQMLHDFYAARLSPEDLADLRNGIAFCVPTSCEGQLDMMPVLVRMYLFSLAGMRDNPNFQPPLAGADINATFDGPGLGTPKRKSIGSVGAGAAPKARPPPPAISSDPVEAAANCVQEVQANSEEGGAPYGVAFIPRRICEESEEVPEVLLGNIAQCSLLGGRLMLVQFDLQIYLARTDSEDATRWDEEVNDGLQMLHEFFEKISNDVVSDFAYGFGLCLPASCSGEGRRGLTRVVLDLFVALAADADSNMAALSSEVLPDPRWGSDINVSDWSSAVRQSMGAMACVPPEIEEGEPEGADLLEEELQADAGESGAQDDEAWEDSEETPGLLNGTGFQVPWWYGCDGSTIAPEWRRFGEMMRSSFVRGAAGPINRTLADAADELLSDYWAFGTQWAYWVSQYSKLTCEKEYTHIRDLSANVEFSPALYMLAGGKRRSDSRWWRKASWQEARSFCPYGFLAALYVRARSLRAAGQRTSAVKDLELARKMLGRCSEMDLMDPHVWGVRALDVELNLLREELSDLDPEALGDSCVAGHSGLCAGAVSSPVGAPADRNGFAEVADYGEPHDLADIWPTRLYDWRSFAWHALQLNEIVRIWTREAARKSGLVASPRLAMLAFPMYLCLFLVPMLLRLWGDDLRLSLFFMGSKWASHEKCLSCMKDYGQRFVVETPYLQELPMKLSGAEAEAKTTFHIDWTLDMTHQEMQSLLRDFMERHPRARGADVFLCTAPLWLCTSLRMVSLKPLITFDLPNYDLGAPPGLRGLPSSNDGRAHRQILRMAHRHFIKDLPAGPPLRALLVREDLWRSYHNVETFATGTAFPFVSALSIYLDARYACQERADVLVMREGSQYRWAPSFRGRLFYTTLQQFETRSSPWRFRILFNLRQRLSFQELAAHRAALWIQLTPASKITLKDLITMEIPIFVPGEAMQSSIAGRIGFHGCRKLAKASVPWAYTLCREVKYPLSRQQLSPLFRHPHLQHFESITDLITQLSGLSCDGLRAISARMRSWNEALVADDAEFWRNAILALAAWDAADVPETPEPAEGAGAGAQGSTAAGAGGDGAVPAFHFPEGPPGWAPAGGQVTEPCGLLAAHCLYEAEIDEPSDGRAQGEWRTGPYECCANAHALQHGPLGVNASTKLGVNASGAGGCLANPAECSDVVLKYGVHLLQELPPLDGA